MTVYLDVIWLLNIFFDSLLLYLTGIILKREMKYIRIFFAGIIGSSVIFFLMTPFYFLGSHPIGKLILSILMIIVAFGYHRFSQFFKDLLTFYFVTFAVGGGIIAIHYFIRFDANLRTETALHLIKGFGDPISWLFILVGFPLAWAFSKKTIHHLEYTKIKYEEIVDVVIKIFDFELKVKGLIDSGNLVKDPFTGRPVIFVSVRNLTNLPNEIFQLAEKPLENVEQLDKFNHSLQGKLSVIPYAVYGQEHKLLIGVRPEWIEIKTNEDVYHTSQCIVSFTLQQLSADDHFQCILHPKLFVQKKGRKIPSAVS